MTINISDNVIARATGTARYKFIILKKDASNNFVPTPGHSTHRILLDGVDGKKYEHYFAVTRNGWIYFYLNNIYLQGDSAWQYIEGWQGDHLTIGAADDGFINVHQTTYKKLNTIKGKKYSMKWTFCDFNAKDFLSLQGNTACLGKDRTIKPHTFDEVWNPRDKNTSFMKKFLTIALTPKATRGGAKPKTYKYKNGLYKINVGQHGGKYIIVNEKKVYLRCKQTGKGQEEQLSKVLINYLSVLEKDILNEVSEVHALFALDEDGDGKLVKIAYINRVEDHLVVSDIMHVDVLKAMAPQTPGYNSLSYSSGIPVL